MHVSINHFKGSLSASQSQFWYPIVGDLVLQKIYKYIYTRCSEFDQILHSIFIIDSSSFSLLIYSYDWFLSIGTWFPKISFGMVLLLSFKFHPWRLYPCFIFGPGRWRYPILVFNIWMPLSGIRIPLLAFEYSTFQKVFVLLRANFDLDGARISKNVKH